MKILVAGYTGLAGSAIYDLLKSRGEDVIGFNSRDVDLIDRNKTLEFVLDMKPEVVIDAAALVGGIKANSTFPVEFLRNNLQIQLNLMEASHKVGVARFIFLGSSCIYPRSCPQPIKEEYLMTGPLESTNSAYATAKIAGLELIRSYRKEFQHRWISLMPTNMYGPRDNFSVESGHVLPALINKFVRAKESGGKKVSLWGSGSPKREFLHSRDLAEATVFLMNHYDGEMHINVGTGEDLRISELADLIAEEVGFDGYIDWDPSKPDGTPRKLLDISRIRKLGWSPRVTLQEGIKETVQWFRENRSKVRA